MPALLWAIFILILLSIPGDRIPTWSVWDTILFFDKFIHGILFVILACLILFGVRKQNPFKRLAKYSITIALMFGAIYGGLTELVQLFFILRRSPEVADWLADIAGTGLGVLIYWSGYRIFVKL
jgi:VanZ family protein